MRCLTRWLLLTLPSLLAACSASNGGGPGGNGDGGRPTDGRVIVADVSSMSDSTVDGLDGVTMSADSSDGSMSGTDSATSSDDGVPTDAMGVPVGGCIPRSEMCGVGSTISCNGQMLVGCPCLPNTSQRCYDGNPALAGIGACIWGSQMCTGSGEFGMWGPCTGWGSPEPVVCGGGMDYMCDGVIDEGCGCAPGQSQSCYDGPAGTEGVGVCQAGTQNCVVVGSGTGWGPCTGEVLPGAPVCDGIDHECDMMQSSGCACVVGSHRSCYDGPMGTDGVGLCHAGAQQCVAATTGSGSMWGPCTGEVVPTQDTCDGLDHTCTGTIGVGCTCIVGDMHACYTGPAGTRMVGACHDGQQQCVAAADGGVPSWGTCMGETLPGPEACGATADTNCDGVIDPPCGPQITCPASITINAGSSVVLTANASSPGHTISAYNWTITGAPTGGIGTPSQWTPAPPTAASETFLPYIVGTYTIHVTATDSAGASVGCNTQVTATGHGLRVELTWDGTGDLDLHLHDGQTGSPWFTADDCYYGNCQSSGAPVLIWDPAGSGTDNPRLDFDNTTANGPENTSIDQPVLSEAYTVAIHDYANADGRNATVQIFCGGVTTPTQTFTHGMSGSGAGNCNGSTFWKVARVVFTSATACTITSINTTELGSNACSAF